MAYRGADTGMTVSQVADSTACRSKQSSGFSGKPEADPALGQPARDCSAIAFCVDQRADCQ
jgi:hypothetical protein